ncbi:MAG: zinc ABC transporter substrate-binding protein [Treponema sp.]|nr:zinc ABC transporter substrate-binding protein [Treponema sp.]
MKIKKLLAGVTLLLALTSSVFAAKAKKLQVVTTIFPEYDWAREIIGDNIDNVELTLLLGNGVDLHSYQPSIQDIAKISTADIFIYVGGESDGWVKDALANATNKNMKVINLMEVLDGKTKAEEMKEGMQASEHHHHHHGEAEDEDEHHHHDEEADEHEHHHHDEEAEEHEHHHHNEEAEEHEHHHHDEEAEEHEHHHHQAFTDADLKDRKLSDWEGKWQSVYDFAMDGSLDHAFEEIAEAGNMHMEDVKAAYQTGFKTDVAEITIKGNKITYKYKDGKSVTAKYKYAGHAVEAWSDEGDAALFRFESTSKKSEAPRYIAFNDHMIEPTKAEHFHIWMGNDGFDSLLGDRSNYPTFFPADMDGHEVAHHLAGHNHSHEEEEEGHHHHHGEVEYDEHVWLSVKFAKTLCVEIADALCQQDSANADSYKANLSSYTAKLDDLDSKFAAAVKAGSKNTLLFGDRFPFRYFVEDYGLDYFAAFVGCSAETEASFETVIFLANKVDELGLNSVLKIESGDGKIARTIVENSKNKNAKILTLDSIQSTTSKQAEAGVTYLSIMEGNVKVIEEALK